jgi:hypothetical protein
MQTLAAQLARAKAALLSAAPRITETSLQTLLALMTLRIQRDGLPGKRYSTNQVHTSWFKGKTLNAGGPAYIKNNKLGTWEGFRGAQGLPTGQPRLSYTNAMFRALGTTAAGSTGAVFRAKLTAADAESAQKVAGNQKRYGDFLQPNTAEVAASRDYVRGETRRIIMQSQNA